MPSYGFHIWDSNLRFVSTLIKSKDIYHSMDLKISSCLTAAILMIVPIIIAAGLNLAFAQEAKKESGILNNMSIDSSGNSQIITSVTEWTGIGALTITTGVLLLLGNNIIPTKNVNNRNTHRIMETKVSIFTLIGILSISVGIIHILLVNEHMTESYVWGIVFLAMGVPQLGYGIVMIFADRLGTNTRKVLYKMGIAANALFVTMFIYVRLFVPPFSPEATPVRELEPNGILTVVIELFIIALLAYLAKEKKEEKITQFMKTRKLLDYFI